MPGNIQKKRRGDPSTRGTLSRLRGPSRRRSPRDRRTVIAASPPSMPTKTHLIHRPRTSLDEAGVREWLSTPRHRPAVRREAEPPTPSVSSASQPDTTNPRDGITAFTLREKNTRDDDSESQGSMTTWPGDNEEENEDSSSWCQGDSSFDFDWADEQADKPPIPWTEIQSYVDFHENRAAHEYWQWDREVLKWRHVDTETGEVVFCSTELD